MEIIIYQDGEFLKDNKESMDKSCICLRFGYNIHCASLLRKRIKIILIMIFWNIVNLFTLDYSLQIGYTDRVLHKRIPSCYGMNNKYWEVFMAIQKYQAFVKVADT